jgi:hypothetical protein
MDMFHIKQWHEWSVGFPIAKTRTGSFISERRKYLRTNSEDKMEEWLIPFVHFYFSVLLLLTHWLVSFKLLYGLCRYALSTFEPPSVIPNLQKNSWCGQAINKVSLLSRWERSRCQAWINTTTTSSSNYALLRCTSSTHWNVREPQPSWNIDLFWSSREGI